MSRLLACAVRALESDPTVTAAVLASLRRLRGWDETQVAAWLGMGVEQLPRLALTRRPDATSADFAETVQALARYVGCDADRLHDALRAAPRSWL